MHGGHPQRANDETPGRGDDSGDLEVQLGRFEVDDVLDRWNEVGHQVDSDHRDEERAGRDDRQSHVADLPDDVGSTTTTSAAGPPRLRNFTVPSKPRAKSQIWNAATVVAK
ncbi:MAG: hypothetical protein JST91_28505 [Actinobacteria bacterium]|nr:hypothetical protein [Actinomycetota bacterium]